MDEFTKGELENLASDTTWISLSEYVRGNIIRDSARKRERDLQAVQLLIKRQEFDAQATRAIARTNEHEAQVAATPPLPYVPQTFLDRHNQRTAAERAAQKQRRPFREASQGSAPVPMLRRLPTTIEDHDHEDNT